MPVYFFDRSEDGEFSSGDYSDGICDVDEACREASRALAEIARDELLTGNHRELAIHIHEAGGLCMLRASLALQMQHPLPGAELPPERLSRRAG
jgi:hypothetical protein